MRIFRVVVVMLVALSALIFWVVGRELPQGELQALQSPAAETPPAPTPTPTNTPTPEPPGIDTAMPQILSISLAPDKIDTLAADQMFTVTAHITDDLSGFRYLDLHFVPASGGTQFMDVRMDSGTLLSGDKRDGIFWGHGYLPQHSAHGRWYVTSVLAVDEVLNGCGTGEMNGTTFQWEPCHLLIELPYFVNGEDSGPPVIASPEPELPSVDEDAAPHDMFLPSLSQ